LPFRGRQSSKIALEELASATARALLELSPVAFCGGSSVISFQRSLPRFSPFALLALVLSPACALRSRSTLASDTSGAEDVAGTESDVESLGTSLVGNDGQSVATASINGGAGTVKTLDNTTTASNDVGSWFQPAGCVQATVDTTKKTATYVFAACTGPLGLVELDGTVDVTWTDAAGQLRLDYSTRGFKINRATIDSWQASAVITATGSARHMVWNAQLSGTTGRGRTFTRTNDKTIDWTVGQPCVTVTGESDGTILGVELKTTLVSFSRCAAECPESGSEIEVENVKSGSTIDIKYSGGAEAVLTADGSTTDISLACGG
jgi:hypothetical protein